jgi:hypothetical protein
MKIGSYPGLSDNKIKGTDFLHQPSASEEVLYSVKL